MYKKISLIIFGFVLVLAIFGCQQTSKDIPQPEIQEETTDVQEVDENLDETDELFEEIGDEEVDLIDKELQDLDQVL